MSGIDPSSGSGPDPGLVRGWLAARSRSRGLPAPIADSGGWRVDTGSETELRRYVFAEAGSGLDALLATIREPRIFVKLCADADSFRALLPRHWAVTDANCMMVPDRPVMLSPTVPAEYRLTTTHDHGVTHVAIIAPDGTLAASGYAAEQDGIFVYDRIVTDESHRRRGLGRAVMAALGEACGPGARQVLTATVMGAALYASLGWRVYAPYTTAACL